MLPIIVGPRLTQLGEFPVKFKEGEDIETAIKRYKQELVKKEPSQIAEELITIKIQGEKEHQKLYDDITTMMMSTTKEGRGQLASFLQNKRNEVKKALEEFLTKTQKEEIKTRTGVQKIIDMIKEQYEKDIKKPSEAPAPFVPPEVQKDIDEITEEQDKIMEQLEDGVSTAPSTAFTIVSEVSERYKKGTDADKAEIITGLLKEFRDPLFNSLFKVFKIYGKEDWLAIMKANKKAILSLVSLIVLVLFGSGGIGAGLTGVIDALVRLVIAETKKELIKENPENVKLIKK